MKSVKNVIQNKQKRILEKPIADFSMLLNKSVFYIEPLSLVGVIVVTFSIIQILNILSLVYFPLEKAADTNANAITIMVSAAAILFPVTLLIIEKWEDGLSAVSKSQTLLNYSLALPLGVVLLASSARYAFPLHPVAGGVLAIICVSVAGWVFFRLIRIVLFSSIRKLAEEAIVKDQVFRSVRKSAEDRAGYTATNAFFKENTVIGIVHAPIVFEDEKYFKWREILPPTSGGVISYISIERLETIYHRLLAKVSPVEGMTGLSNVVRQEQPYEQALKFYLKVHVGEEVDQSTPLVEIHLLKSILDSKKVFRDDEAFIKDLQDCFKFDVSPDQALIVEQFKEFCDELRLVGLKAAKENDHSQLLVLERYIGAWLSALSDSFEILKLKYDLKAARGEGSSFFYNSGAEWAPLNEAVELIEEIGARSLVSNPSDQPEFVGKIIDLTDSLFRKMAAKNEFLSCNRLLEANLRLCSDALYKKHMAFEWLVNNVISDLSSFVKYHIRYKLEKNLDEGDATENALEMTQMILLFGQEYLRLSLTADSPSLYRKILQFVFSQPDVYKYETIERQIAVMKRFGNNTQNNEDDAKLEKLNRKMEIIKFIRKWREEILIGQGTLILMAEEGDARGIKSWFKGDKVITFFEAMKPYLLNDLLEAISLVIRIKNEDSEEKWHWKTWEDVPSMDEGTGAKWLKFRLFLDNFLGIILLHAASKDKNPKPIPETLLDHGLRFEMEVGDNSLKQRLPNCLDLAVKFNLLSATEGKAAKNKVDEYLSDFSRRSEEIWDKKVASTPLSPKILQEVGAQFEEAFIDAAHIRSLVTIVQNKEADPGKLSKEQWGAYNLYERQYFIEDKGASTFSGLGTTYGSGFAKSDDDFVLSEILRNKPPKRELSVPDAVKEAISIGMDLNKIFILIARDPEADLSLRSNSQFEPIFRAPQEVQELHSVKPDGFFISDSTRIPVYLLFVSRNVCLQAIVVAQKDSIILEQTIDVSSPNYRVLEKTGFIFKVDDPLIDQNFKNRLLTEVPNETDETRAKMAPLRIGLGLYQRMKVVVPPASKIITGTFSNGDIGDI